MLNELLDRFLAHYYVRHPVNATFTGVHQYDHVLPDWSTAARDAELAEIHALRSEFQAVLHAEGETHSPRAVDANYIDGTLALSNLDVRMAELESNHFRNRNPALWTGEAIFGIVSLMIRDFAPIQHRLRSIIDRLDAIPRFLGDMSSTIEHDAPVAWIERARSECRTAQQLFSCDQGGGLREWLQSALSASDGENDQSSALSQAVAGLATAAQRACDAFKRTDDILSAMSVLRDEVYVGRELYELLLQQGHWCRRESDDLLEDAMRELAVEQQRLRDMCAEFGGSWASVQALLADDCQTPATYLDGFQTRWNECREFALNHDVVTWPDWSIRYVPIPRWAGNAAPQLYWLFYRSPSAFDTYTTHDYVVIPVDESLSPDEQRNRLRTCNNSVITLNHVVHHGALGHHVQNWHANHRSRSRIGTIAAIDCASRIGMFLGGSMAEGWACYATELMDELGFLTPLERVAQQHSRVRMLARAIVDISMHHGTLSFDDAVALYVQEVGMSPAVAKSEAVKNQMFPCTAVMYWLGTQTILDLRATTQRRRGAQFSMRAFHDELLSWGAIPPRLVATLMGATP